MPSLRGSTRFCERNIRGVVGTARLLAHMNDLLRHLLSRCLRPLSFT